ncbi:TadE family protein [uncultured Paracoccus sp.]|uniref:TadE/TadG family type IV pilus assembly protein n=1 Tax=uncultured Paracoccus sp. TaxID=189685 RepID=UPI0026327570|nr:TadE family protein [uncultured Paracoccus sp.]
MGSFPLTVYRKLSSILVAERGASAIEFALLAPVLVLGLLGTVDVGRALTEQMTIGSLLRTGAQSIMAGVDAAKIEPMLIAASGDESVFVEVPTSPMCACPDNPQVTVDCSTTCPGAEPTGIYYSLTASKSFSGIFLPDIVLSRSLQVQVR